MVSEARGAGRCFLRCHYSWNRCRLSLSLSPQWIMSPVHVAQLCQMFSFEPILERQDRACAVG